MMSSSRHGSIEGSLSWWAGVPRRRSATAALSGFLGTNIRIPSSARQEGSGRSNEAAFASQGRLCFGPGATSAASGRRPLHLLAEPR